MKTKNKVLLFFGAIISIALPITVITACGSSNSSSHSYQKYVDNLSQNTKVYYSTPFADDTQPLGWYIMNVYLMDDSAILSNGYDNQNDLALNIKLPYLDKDGLISGVISYGTYKLSAESQKVWSKYNVDGKSFNGYQIGKWEGFVTHNPIFDWGLLPFTAQSSITFTPIDTTKKFDPTTGKPGGYKLPINMNFTIQILHP